MYKSNVFWIIILVIIHILTRLKTEPIRERTQLMNRYLLHQNSSRCADIKHHSYMICEMYDDKDAKAIGYDCGFYNYRCPDGSYNKTCMLLFVNPDGTMSYTCTCHSNKQPQMQPWHYSWSKWYNVPGEGAGIYQELTDSLITDSPALVLEYRSVIP